MNKREDREKFDSSLNRNTPINQAWNRVRQLKGKDPKKVNILEVNGAQYKNYLFHKITDYLFRI